MSNIAFLFLPLAFSSLPAVLPFVSPSSQVEIFIDSFSVASQEMSSCETIFNLANTMMGSGPGSQRRDGDLGERDSVTSVAGHLATSIQLKMRDEEVSSVLNMLSPL